MCGQIAHDKRARECMRAWQQSERAACGMRWVGRLRALGAHRVHIDTFQKTSDDVAQLDWCTCMHVKGKGGL